jgi:hypothetical protein
LTIWSPESDGASESHLGQEKQSAIPAAYLVKDPRFKPLWRWYNKQAFIADPDAGTYRQLVEAAESCQVAIIHPGKPRNPNEPGLDELVKQAEPFL